MSAPVSRGSEAMTEGNRNSKGYQEEQGHVGTSVCLSVKSVLIQVKTLKEAGKMPVWMNW